METAIAFLAYAVGTFVALFPIANPIGAVPIFYSLTETDSRADRRRQARRIAINVILILALFLVAGRTVLEFFGISLNVLRIAGGLLYVCLALGESLFAIFGSNGFGALNRVLGFFILAIAVQLIADGVLSLLHTAAPTLFR